MRKNNVRVIAFYLPQFHPIPENDVWWGKGFTEWTNVRNARPLFRGHYQPRVPADLGYYDLRIPQVRETQAEMAREAGIEGFCYWHYWFGHGKQLLERPFNEVLRSGKPDFPFCLGWANETWSGIWHGQPGRVLMEQTYPGVEDYNRHFYANLDAFLDDRYIRINDKPLFYVYRPFNIPNTDVFLDCWRELAAKNGLPGIHFVGASYDARQARKVIELGYDAIHTHWQKSIMLHDHLLQFAWNKFAELTLNGKFKMSIWDYEDFAAKFSNELDSQPNYCPTLLSGWDNSPRSGRRGQIFVNYSPETFDVHVKNVLKRIEKKAPETNIAFLKSWNEWAEGNYVEPDVKYGWDFLNVLKNNLKAEQIS